MNKTSALLFTAVIAMAGALSPARLGAGVAAGRSSAIQFSAIQFSAIQSSAIQSAVNQSAVNQSSVNQSATDDPMQEKVVAAEKAGLDALKAGDLARFGELTADDALFVDTHGPASKAQVLNNVVGFRLTDYSMGDVAFKRLAADSGMITYKISETGNSHGRDFTVQVYVTSIWVQRGGKWVCLFSQETAAKN
jgi:ketosteroid isomerase-like protein